MGTYFEVVSKEEGEGANLLFGFFVQDGSQTHTHHTHTSVLSDRFIRLTKKLTIIPTHILLLHFKPYIGDP